MNHTPMHERIAGAPISWGVCEAPGWGYEIGPGRVLQEMRALGLASTELGPTGYLGATPGAVRETLAGHWLQLVGGFLPVPLHIDPELDLTEATDAIATLAEGGSTVVVLAARSADGSYDRKVRLTDEEWPVFLANLDRVQQIVRDHGMMPTLHPHVGTAIEDRASVLRLLDFSDIALCLDTGHLLIGGTDPLELLAKAADRVAHVHLKDVNVAVADTISAGDTSYQAAVRAGLYTPLGQGDLDIAEIVRTLEAAHYQGWYVLEQDTALGEESPDDLPRRDTERSLAHLATITDSL